MNPILANVIFPAFTAPYFSPLFFPIAGLAAVATEFYCYRKLTRHARRPLTSDIIAANLLSWLVGVIIGNLLPSGLTTRQVGDAGHKILTSGPNFELYVIISFFFACILSILIEGWFIKWAARFEEVSLESPYKLSAFANGSSYFVLSAIVVLWVMCFSF